MATLPPRRLKKNAEPSGRRNISSMDVLMQMGFGTKRSQKALVTTGDRGVQISLDWLLSHVNDPTLDNDVPRDYILYLCPVGDLQKELLQFWKQSLADCGWNRAHNIFPHVTLCSFFKVADDQVGTLLDTMKNVTKAYKNIPQNIELDYFSSTNFIGLFVADKCAEIFKDLTAKLAAELKSLGITVEPHKKQLHVSLAYMYQTVLGEKLETLARAINLKSAAEWELRLYSRDPRSANKQVRKVVYPHSPEMEDELEMIVGDFLYISEDDIKSSADGWYQATSWLTGCSGLVPGNFTEQTAESETWTMHLSIRLNEKDTDSNKETDGRGDVCNGAEGLYSSALYARINKQPKGSKKEGVEHIRAASAKAPSSRGRQLYLVRHGERVDFCFGQDWIRKCFDASGNYIRYDLNLPKVIARRKGGHTDYAKDSPLTTLGTFQALVTGEALGQKDVPIKHIYASPSLRCVQTASHILKGMGLALEIHIEPGLFEWLGWYQEGLPKWMTPAEFREFGLKVATSHTPVVPVSKLELKETTEQYYSRCHLVTKEILKKHEADGGAVLLLGHAATLDTHSRELVGKPARAHLPFVNIVRQIPYCGIVVCQEDMTQKDKWSLVEPPLHAFSHSKNSNFSWTILKD